MNKILFDPVKIGRTLSQQAVDRLCSTSSHTEVPPLDPKNFLIVTGSAFAQTLSEHIPEIPKESFIGEPAPRSTMPAVLLAASRVRQYNPEGILCVVTADHIISDTNQFRKTLATARQLATEKDCIVTIGIKPTDTAHDWIGFGAINSDSTSPITITKHLFSDCIAYPVKRFEEKPSVTRAAEMIADNQKAGKLTPQTEATGEQSKALAWSWNAGMFVFRVSTVEKALQLFHPEIYEKYIRMCEAPTVEERNRIFLTFESKITHPLNPAAKVDCSIDYALMMPLTLTSSSSSLSAAVIPGSFPWFDVGGWSAFRTVRQIPQDAHANILYGNGCVQNTVRSIVVAVNESHRLTLHSASDLVAVLSTEGVLAVIPDGISQRLKELKGAVDKAKNERDVLVECEDIQITRLIDGKEEEEEEEGKEGKKGGSMNICRVCMLGCRRVDVTIQYDTHSHALAVDVTQK